MVTITFLGIGAGQTKEYETTSFIAEFRDKTLLIDTGPSVVKLLAKVGYSSGMIDYVFLSHSHADHIIGFPYLLFADLIERIFNLTRRSKSVLNIITLPEIYKFLLESTRFYYPSFKVPRDLKLLEVNASEFCKFNFDDFKIVTAPVLHSVPTIGIRIEFPNLKIAYAPDSMYCENTIKLAENCDLLIHAAFCSSKYENIAHKLMHGTSADAGKVAKEANVKRLALVDLSFLVSDKEELINDAKKYFDGYIFIPEELKRMEV